jgi:hypothetical protein
VREKIQQRGWNIVIYPEGRRVYGYGADQEYLKSEGFSPVEKKPDEIPHLMCKTITDGLISLLSEQDYIIIQPKKQPRVHLQVIKKHPEPVFHNRLLVYQGWNLRSFFWRDPFTVQILFGLVVDVIWKFRDAEDRPLSTREIRQRFGSDALIAIGQAQGEYLPGTRNINFHVARQNMHARILPFVEGIGEFQIPLGLKATVLVKPVTIFLGGKEGA